MPEATAEILVHLEYLRRGQDETNRHLAALNGRTRLAEQEIAILKDRADHAVALAAASATAAEAAASSNRSSSVKWGAGMAALISGIIAGLMQAFGNKP
jgi:hypothetical protein